MAAELSSFPFYFFLLIKYHIIDNEIKEIIIPIFLLQVKSEFRILIEEVIR